MATPGSASDVIRIGAGREAASRHRLPPHCVSERNRAPSPEVPRIQRLLRAESLHSVCEEARCPNRSECWARRHVTFMLMGDVCTRACRFCAVATGLPAAPPDPAEPERVARAAEALGLRHVVLTSVDRDDLPDGGAAHFAAGLRALRARLPEASLEVLTPDFQGDPGAVGVVCAARPDVYNHNVETVPRLYRSVRPGASLGRSLGVLSEAARRGEGAVVKSGFMLGLGERIEEVRALLAALRDAGVESVTIGQYLRPSRRHLPVERYWDPEEFDALAGEARQMGFADVASGPLVRSSYNADETFRRVRERRAGRSRADRSSAGRSSA
jgi:lipoic acid synthetase